MSIKFQSTPPRRGRRLRRWGDCRLKIVSIPAPAMGARVFGSQSERMIYLFNPRPRDGGDEGIGGYTLAGNKVSIHAPAKGATRKDFICENNSSCFNPRPREGGDLTNGNGKP